MSLDLSQEELKDLRDAFNLFDTDGNGTIDVREMKAALDAMGFESKGGDTIYQMIGRIDQDGDGSVDFDEFVKFFTEQFTASDTRSSTRAVFDMFDVEGKGYIAVDDVEAVAEELGNYVDAKAAREYFQMVNTSNTGYITFDEFYSIYAKGKFALSY